jgi:L-lysine epsilon oxidase-like protein
MDSSSQGPGNSSATEPTIADTAELRHFEGDSKPPYSKIVRAAIHPSIGVARIGSSEDEYFIGPEVIDPRPQPLGYYKDDKGALKREAARFRIYGYNEAGEVVTELTADNADILWTVHVANKKAAWYQFQLALDIPEAASSSNLNPEPSHLRNSTAVEIDGVRRIPTREELTIDPGPRSIRGRNKSGTEYGFDTGKFFKKEVYLGELRTDEMGRLVYLGGHGAAASFLGPDVEPATFANNDGWHDDISDGPVKAEVSINGRPIPVDFAWVVVAPPNYAPQVKGGRTMYDLMFDTYVQEGRLPFPSEISFRRDIYPIFRRLNNLQWVNQGYAIQFGPGGRHNFADPQVIGRLADNSKEKAPAEFRLQVFNMFRDYDRDGESPVPWPWEYGDAMNIPPAETPRQNLALAPTQYQMLRKWANGDFMSDWSPDGGTAAGTLDDVPLQERPAMLDRAALSFCLADAFHPGCEMTWIMRHGTLYMSPFRIRHRALNTAEPKYGSQLTQEMVLKPDGALYGQGPGTITRWMAVPWQTDTASCRSGYYAGFGAKYDPYLPTFWPARVPNHVLTEQDYEIVVDGTRPYDERVEAFGRRAVWLRGLGSNYMEALASMIHDFDKLGVVEIRPGAEGDSYFPEVMLVESKPEFAEDVPPLQGLMLFHLPEGALADEVTTSAVSEAAVATGQSEEEFVVGPIDKVKRFRNLR